MSTGRGWPGRRAACKQARPLCVPSPRGPACPPSSFGMAASPYSAPSPAMPSDWEVLIVLCTVSFRDVRVDPVASRLPFAVCLPARKTGKVLGEMNGGAGHDRGACCRRPPLRADSCRARYDQKRWSLQEDQLAPDSWPAAGPTERWINSAAATVLHLPCTADDQSP